MEGHYKNLFAPPFSRHSGATMNRATLATLFVLVTLANGIVNAASVKRSNFPTFSNVKRLYEDNPLAKQLDPEELKHLVHGSPEWNMALFEQLLGNKGGKGLQDLIALEELNGHNNVICKVEPFNECFGIDGKGEMTYLGPQQRPVRLLRIY